MDKHRQSKQTVARIGQSKKQFKDLYTLIFGLSCGFRIVNATNNSYMLGLKRMTNWYVCAAPFIKQWQITEYSCCLANQRQPSKAVSDYNVL